MRHAARMRSIDPGWVLLGVLLLSACGPQGPESTAPPPARQSQESFKEFGDYQLHYNALRTDTLTPEVARVYGIERSKNRVLLNVMVRRREGGAQGGSVESAVSVKAYNLNGQLKPLTMRRVNEGQAVYYIGETSIAGNEILVFEINAVPANETQALQATLRREFFAD